jgi:hypothetical protein
MEELTRIYQPLGCAGIELDRPEGPEPDDGGSPPQGARGGYHQGSGPEICLVADINTSEVLEGLLPDTTLSAKIRERMRTSGYDCSHPIVLGTWPGQDEPVIVDGHTRHRAAKDAGIVSIPAVTLRFDAEQDAIEYAIWNQGHRRAWTDATIFASLSTYHKSKKRGPKQDLAGNQAKLGKAADATAKLFGIGRDKIERALYVLNHGDEFIRSQVANGSMGINKAYTEIRNRNGKVKSKAGRKGQVNSEANVNGDNVPHREAPEREQMEDRQGGTTPGELDPKSPSRNSPNLAPEPIDREGSTKDTSDIVPPHDSAGDPTELSAAENHSTSALGGAEVDSRGAGTTKPTPAAFSWVINPRGSGDPAEYFQIWISGLRSLRPEQYEAITKAVSQVEKICMEIKSELGEAMAEELLSDLAEARRS